MHGIIRLLFSYIFRKNKKLAKSENGKVTMRFHRAFAILGCIGILSSLAMYIVATLTQTKPEEWVVIYIGMGFFFILSAPLLLYVWIARVVYDAEKITAYNLYNFKNTIYWKDATHLTFNKMSMYLTVSDGKNKVKIHTMLIGLDGLIETIKQKLSHVNYIDALESLNKSIEPYKELN